MPCNSRCQCALVEDGRRVIGYVQEPRRFSSILPEDPTWQAGICKYGRINCRLETFLRRGISIKLAFHNIEQSTIQEHAMRCPRGSVPACTSSPPNCPGHLLVPWTLSLELFFPCLGPLLFIRRRRFLHLDPAGRALPPHHCMSAWWSE